VKIDLQNSIAFKINKTANNINSIINHILSEHNIAIEQRVAMEIIKNETDVTLTKIAGILSKDKTTISRTLRTLEKKGFINKIDSENDRRVNFIELTLKGENTLKDSEEVVNSFRYDLISKMNEDEVKIFFELLGKVTTQLKTYNL